MSIFTALAACGGPMWVAQPYTSSTTKLHVQRGTNNQSAPPIRSHSREMPEWAKNNHKPTAAQYAELMLDADVHAALKPFLNPFKMPIQ